MFRRSSLADQVFLVLMVVLGAVFASILEDSLQERGFPSLAVTIAGFVIPWLFYGVIMFALRNLWEWRWGRYLEQEVRGALQKKQEVAALFGERSEQFFSELLGRTEDDDSFHMLAGVACPFCGCTPLFYPNGLPYDQGCPNPDCGVIYWTELAGDLQDSIGARFGLVDAKKIAELIQRLRESEWLWSVELSGEEGALDPEYVYFLSREAVEKEWSADEAGATKLHSEEEQDQEE